MSVLVSEPSRNQRTEVSAETADAGPVALSTGRHRKVERITNRVRRDGKFFRLGSDKFYVKGVTYGPFEMDADKHPLPSREQVEKDFAQIVELGANCVRIYHTPPKWFLDLAESLGLKIFLDVAWAKNISFVGNRDVAQLAKDAVRTAAKSCGNHAAIFAISVGE